VRVLVFEPIDEHHTSTYVDGFWAPGTQARLIEEITAFGAVVGQEDTELVTSVHRGLRSGAIPHGRLLLDSEKLIQHFQLLVHDALAGVV
jgi:phenylpropionate dioxygenase-like ring-hydroxylating dioxygenase large terminal subunit